MMKCRLPYLAGILLIPAFIFSSCLPAIDNLPPRTPELPTDNIYSTAKSMGAIYFFSRALEISGLDYMLRTEGPFTVFAPGNGAFIRYLNKNNYFDINEVPPEELKKLLLNHIIPESIRYLELRPEYRSTLRKIEITDNPLSLYIGRVPQFYINGVSEIISQHWTATNGYIYLVSEIIEPPLINNHLLSNPDLTLFTESVRLAGFSDLLSSKENIYTVFAPTNKAFSVLIDENPAWNTLEDIPLEALRNILRYHIIESKNLLSRKLRNEQSVVTSANTPIVIDRDYDLIRLRDRTNNVAKIMQKDIQAENGIIHIIDRVILPE